MLARGTVRGTGVLGTLRLTKRLFEEARTLFYVNGEYFSKCIHVSASPLCLRAPASVAVVVGYVLPILNPKP